MVAETPHPELRKGEENSFGSKEWPSLRRLNVWGPKWHRNGTQVMPESWGVFLTLQPLICLSFLKSALAAAVEGLGSGYFLASFRGLPRAVPDTLEITCRGPAAS